jgi:hypothetical protein
MKVQPSLGMRWKPDAALDCACAMILAAAALAPCAAWAQSLPSGNRGGLALSAGAAGSGCYLQYGERQMLGASAFVDADTRRRLGIEAEGRWIEFHQRADVHAETYSVGVRYHLDFGRLQPYAKGLAGLGNFNFPYNLASGHYLLVTAGGGFDLAAGRRFQFRVADVEYQYWPQFTYGAMSSATVSAGLRVRFF